MHTIKGLLSPLGMTTGGLQDTLVGIRKVCYPCSDSHIARFTRNW